MNKRTIKIEKISDNNIYINKYSEEIQKIKSIPKMPSCEFLHIGTTSDKETLGESIVDILVVVENLHEITTFDEKRLNNIKYHRIAHNGIKGVIKYVRLVDYFNMNYDVVLHIVQRGTDIYKDFLLSDKALKTNFKKEYIEFKENNKLLSFKEYSENKLIFINEVLKKVNNND